MKKLALSIATLLALGVVSACTTDKPAEVVRTADQTSTDAPAADGPTPEPVPATAKIGDTVQVGDWQVKVVKIDRDAAAAMEQANQFNDKAKGQYFLVTYAATYTGTERTADIQSDLSWTFTTTDNIIHDEAIEVTPADSDSWPTAARKGGTIKFQTVFDLVPSKITGGTLTVEGYDADYNEVYADFTV